MKVILDRINDDYLFEGKGKTGVPIRIDNTSQEGAAGASPMELLLMGVGGCSAIDVIAILKKQKQEITGYHMEVEGFRKEVKQAKPFESIVVRIFLEGNIDPKKAKRAGELSFDKYCSVSITLEGSVSVSHEILINGESID
ncbi:OsmC family protein [Aureisphaera galaxeae]|uniref:OsmC family protein n=1 Tax=Aureisphaera galaxeae TaxID=1538023 RepID=UPI0023502783|nr:OsmC family protein [Aureisphaera galaxeae]MDC8003153.1 OsmC family protein [Aureisphaera galaxeae]